MKINLTIPKSLLAGIDLINTLNGGRAATRVEMQRREQGYEVLVKVPGLSPEGLHIDVREGRLWLYALYPVLAHGQAHQQQLPLVLGNPHIPGDVDLEGITARYDRKSWRVLLPYNEGIRGFEKNIDIDF